MIKAICISGVLCSQALAAQGLPDRKSTATTLSGWQLEAHLPSNMSPAFSLDCMAFPAQADRFARSYIELIWAQAGCHITKPVSGDDNSASAEIQCPFGTRQFEFKKTSDTTLGINEIETEEGGARSQVLLLLKQCDASIEYDCSESGKAAWHETRPPQAVNYACEERMPSSAEPPHAGQQPNYGFPIEMKKISVMTNMIGEHEENGLPEQCNWYEIEGEEFCHTPSTLEQLVDNPHAVSLANIAIELRVGEREFAGSPEYCQDVKALAAQMPWMTGVTCDVEGK